jgi:hypothetical protein
VSQHVLTFAELKAEAEHAISGAPDSRTSTARIVNGALEYLTTIHAWTWRHTLTTLNATLAVGTIDLPADFGELIALVPFEWKSRGARKCSWRELVACRVDGAADAGAVLYLVGQAAQTVATTTPARQLFIAPIPTVSTANAFYLVYRRLSPKLVNDTDVPAIPHGMAELLRILVRAVAFSGTVQQEGHDWQHFNRVLPDYKALDSRAGGDNLGGMVDQLGDDFMAGGEEGVCGPGTSVLMVGDY